ncbi:hypothetical protein CJD36_022460 [Flavipsychrobacter stenotrophus]|uniref:DUF4382 domain-containing protein n=1 Tax=Flavipsychrobacter stenotrophus TaxID=2077091 RepID=A0A2S7SQ84_9BACT|nr:DUF4382 domain-containing protein [Flavipsychrobacter stenotrophus]PQJ08765.1 hypothetical protein CJD36_022460 [Flavipsychrobacter stenotrophus]
MMKKNWIYTSVLVLSSFVALYSCKKDNNNSGDTSQVSMHLTDAPSSIYDHVYIDIQQVEVTMSGSSAVTLTPIRPGVYDILHFRNGLDTLLMRASIPAGTVSQIRLILGTNNSVVVAGTSYPLSTPSAQESGVKLNLNQTFAANGSYDVWIDFDAAKSINLTGSNTYKLKPVIRAYSAATNGSVKGHILPLTSMSIVYAIDGADTFAAIPDNADGFFKINGMASGSYTLMVQPGVAGLAVYSQTNVSVTYGTIFDLGTITLHP